MGSRYFYDRDGEWITLNKWAHLMADDDYRVVGQTWVGKRRWLVSTVWLGLDLNVHGASPHIFETMVFRREDMLDVDGYTRRYSTIGEARRGHQETVRLLRKEVRSHS